MAFFASLGDIVGTENTVQKSKLLFATLLVPGPVNNFPFQLNGFWSSQCQNCGYSQGECVRWVLTSFRICILVDRNSLNLNFQRLFLKVISIHFRRFYTVCYRIPKNQYYPWFETWHNGLYSVEQ